MVAFTAAPAGVAVNAVHALKAGVPKVTTASILPGANAALSHSWRYA
jgi:hypothetical protein